MFIINSINAVISTTAVKIESTRMWADAQRDGRPSKNIGGANKERTSGKVPSLSHAAKFG